MWDWRESPGASGGRWRMEDLESSQEMQGPRASEKLLRCTVIQNVLTHTNAASCGVFFNCSAIFSLNAYFPGTSGVSVVTVAVALQGRQYWRLEI